MRIAVCFYGLVGSAQKKFGKGKSLNPKLSYKFYKKNVKSLCGDKNLPLKQTMNLKKLKKILE